MSYRRHLITAALGTALLPTVAALAAENARQIEEIVVTAQKRAQSFNDVGITVSAFTGDDVKALGFTQMQDVAAQAPNVKINDTLANSIPNVSIRGVGLNDYAANNNPAAGIYVDEVYLVSPAMLTFQLFDVERVEILKGPQGTLYGRNTTAGTVNFVASKPTSEFGSAFTVDYGRYDYKALDGFVSGPLTTGLMGRLAVQTVQQGEGWQKNRLTGDDVGEIDRTSWRALLDWQPSENVSVLLNVHGGKDESDVMLVKIDNPFSPEDDGDDDPFRSGSSVDPRMDIETQGAALTVNWDLSEMLTLTSVTGYEDFSRFHVEDRDATSLEQLDGYFDNDIEQISQELRLTYQSPDAVLIGGLFYGEDEVETRDRFDSTDLLGLLGLAGVNSIGNEYVQKTESLAAFVHAEYRFAPAWRVNGGLRYTDEQKDFEDAFTYLIAGGLEAPVFPAVSNDYSTEDVSGKIGLDYVGFDDALVYASISRGFKSGGFQGQLTFNPADLQPFDDEHLWAYEIGAKARLAEETLQLNGAMFYYDYADLQFYGGLFDSPVGTLFGITNVGDAEVVGAEVELWWKPAVGLDVRLGIGALDTEITDSVVAGVAEGSDLPNAPELTFNGMVRYEWALTAGLRGDIVLASRFQDDVNYDVVRNPEEAKEDGYWLTDARIGVLSADGRWSAYLWGRNLADERYRTQVLFSSVGYGESYGPPRTYGVSFSVNL